MGFVCKHCDSVYQHISPHMLSYESPGALCHPMPTWYGDIMYKAPWLSFHCLPSPIPFPFKGLKDYRIMAKYHHNIVKYMNQHNILNYHHKIKKYHHYIWWSYGFEDDIPKYLPHEVTWKPWCVMSPGAEGTGLHKGPWLFISSIEGQFSSTAARKVPAFLFFMLF